MELIMGEQEVMVKHSLHSPDDFISLRVIFDEKIRLEFDEELLIITFLQAQNHHIVKINNCFGFSQN